MPIHGGNPGPMMRRLSVPECPVVDFSVNVSPLGLPSPVKAAWPQLMDAATLYPSENGTGVVDYYSTRFDLPKETILPGNGSADLIYLCFRALPIRSAALITPTFLEYERALRVKKVALSYIPLTETDTYQAPQPTLLAQTLETVDALIVCSPNNPTGTVYDSRMLLNLADAFPNKLICIDEAFVQFRSDWRSSTMLRHDRLRKNVVVFHSLTKIYAVPGLRIGAAIGHPETIRDLERQATPWMVNTLAERIAHILLDCADYETGLRQLILKERHYFLSKLGEVRGFRLFETPANFFLAKWQYTDELDDLLRPLLVDGLHVRDCRNFTGLEEGFFRFSIQQREQNRKLVSALQRHGNG